MSSNDDGFIGRWSRRKSENAAPGGLKKKTPDVAPPVRGRMITEPIPVKQVAAEGEETHADAVAVAEVPEDTAQDTTELEQSEPDIEALEGIDIDALDFDADFTKFMQPGVPERLRQRALQRLWNTNPILANVDGLNDYDDDFTDAALAVDVLKTAWKVGQGYLTDEEVAERDADRLAEDTAAAMQNGFDLQPQLSGDLVHLRPLRASDFDALYAVASDPYIWEQHPAKNRHEPEAFRAYFDEAIESGGALVILDAETKKMVGATRYHNFDPDRSSVEIGWTFLDRACWGGEVNNDLKTVMLDHAFQFVERVEFLIAENNARSQRSVEKIGATPSGSQTKSDGTAMLVFTLERSTP